MKRNMAAVLSRPVGRMRQVGVTLIEMMVGLVVSTIIIGGIGAVYLASAEANRTREATSTMAENVRYAAEHMARNLRMAGWSGPGVTSGDWDNGSKTLTVQIPPGSGGNSPALSTGSPLTISYRQEADELQFRRGGGDWMTLASGLQDGGGFGVDLMMLSGDVMAINVTLTLATPAGGLDIDENLRTIPFMVALRNPILAETSNSNPGPSDAGGGGASTPGGQDDDPDAGDDGSGDDQGTDGDQSSDDDQGSGDGGAATGDPEDDGSVDDDVGGTEEVACQCSATRSGNSSNVSYMTTSSDAACSDQCCASSPGCSPGKNETCTYETMCPVN